MEFVWHIMITLSEAVSRLSIFGEHLSHPRQRGEDLGDWRVLEQFHEIWTPNLGQPGNIATGLSTCGASCSPYKEVQLPGASMIHQTQQNRSNQFDQGFRESDWLLTVPQYFSYVLNTQHP